MIYLFDRSKKLQKIIPRKHINNATQTKVRNGIYQLAVEVPIFYETKQGTHYNHQKSVSKAEFAGHYDDKNRFQLYKIYSRNITANEQGEFLLFDGVHIFFDEAKAMGNIHDRRFRDSEAKAPADVAFNSIGWTVIDYDVTDRHNINFYRASVTDAWNDLISTYGVEFDYELQFDGRKIISKNIIMKKQIGRWTGQRFAYGTNVLTLTQEQDESEVYTAAVGRGRGEESGDGFGPRLEFGDIAWSKDGITKPVGQNYIELPSATAEYGFIENGIVKPRIAPEVVFEDIEDKKKLADATYYWLLENCLPKATWKTEVARIGNLNLGDTVGVLYKAAGIIKRARVEKIEYNLLDPELSKLTLGDFHHFENRQMKRINAQIKRLGRDSNDRITRIKNEWNAWIDNQFTAAINQFEQALIDVHAEIEADREKMTNLIEGTRTEFTDNINAEITQTKEYAEEQAQAKASAVQTNLDSFKDSHQQLYDEVTGNVLDIDTFLGDKSKTLKQQFDKVRTDFGTLQTDLDGVESDLTTTKTDLQKQLDDAKNVFDDLEIGGRNLVPDSNNFEDRKFLKYLGSSVTMSEKLEDGYTKIKTDGGTSVIKLFYMVAYLKSNYTNREVTLSFDIINHSENDMVIGHNWLAMASETIPAGFIGRYVKTGKISGHAAGQIQFNTKTVDDNLDFSIRNLKIEVGNVATDWTPAPEDTEQKITTLNQQIEFIDGQLSAKLEQTDLLPINNKITEYGNTLTANAQSIQTLIDKTELHDDDITKWSNQTTANAEGIERRLTKVEYTTDKAALDADITKWSNLTTETAEGLEQTIGRVSTAEGKLSNAELSIKANADSLKLTATKSEVEQAIDGIEVGGRNLLENSNFLFDLSGWRAQYRSTIDKQSNGSYLISNTVATYNGIRSPKTINVTKGQTYTVTIEGARSSNMSRLDYLYLMYDLPGVINQPLDIPSFDAQVGKMSRISCTFVANQTAENCDLLIANRPINGLPETYQTGFYIKNVKIEKGNKATDWSPAPEDTDAKITKVSSDLEVEAGRIEGLVTDISKDYVKQSSVKVTSDRVTIGSTVVNGSTIGSVLSVSPTGIDAVADAMRLSGDLYVDGDITSLAVKAIEGNFSRLFASSLTTNVIKSNHIQTDTALARKLFATNANIDELITRTHFSNSIKALSLDAVDADIGNLRTKILEANVINARHVNFTDALVQGIYAHEAFIGNASIRAANIRDLDAISIHANTFSSTMPGSNREITMEDGRAYFKYGSVTVETTSGRKVIIDGNINRSQTMTARMPNLQHSSVTELGSWYYTNSQQYVAVLTEYYVHNARWLVASIGLNKWGYAANIDARMNSSSGYSAYVSTTGLGDGTHYQWMRIDLGEPLDIPTSGMVQYEIKTRDSKDNPRAHLGNRFLTDNPPVG